MIRLSLAPPAFSLCFCACCLLFSEVFCITKELCSFAHGIFEESLGMAMPTVFRPVVGNKITIMYLLFILQKPHTFAVSVAVSFLPSTVL